MSENATIEETIVEDAIVAPKEEKKKKDRTREKLQPPFAVIVHNDDCHTFLYVIELLRKICGHDRQKAVELTYQVHSAGQAVVWTGSLEVAELKRDQIRGYGPDFYAEKTVRFPLGVTIEPMPSD